MRDCCNVINIHPIEPKKEKIKKRHHIFACLNNVCFASYHAKFYCFLFWSIIYLLQPYPFYNYWSALLIFLLQFALLQLVFVVFTGESWGYLGSRRFLLELDQHSDAVKGLDFSMIETVLLSL